MIKSLINDRLFHEPPPIQARPQIITFDRRRSD
jgi:hypothetical protein